MVGKEILGYHVDEKIGSGGFGTVYKVSKTNAVGTYVRALKHIKIPTRRQYINILNSMGGDLSKTDDYFSELLKEIVGEIRILSALSESGNHNIIRYYENDIVETPSPKSYEIYILMEYLTPFPDHMDETDLTVRDVIQLGKDILNALISCHERNIIHRDIKDDNIFVSADGTYKLGDFGISKVLKDQSRAASIKGTPNFIAPEVYLGKENYDSSVDLYSLGIVLYRLLNHMRNPFMPKFPETYTSTDEDLAFEARMVGKTPELPMLAENELGKAIVKAIMPRAERYNFAKEFLVDLKLAERALSEEELSRNISCWDITASSESPQETGTRSDLGVTFGVEWSFSESETETNEADRHLFDTISVENIKQAEEPQIEKVEATDDDMPNKDEQIPQVLSEGVLDNKEPYLKTEQTEEAKKAPKSRNRPKKSKHMRWLAITVTAFLLIFVSLFAFLAREEQPHIHNLQHYDVVEAKCDRDGNIEYWECSDCMKIYSDADAQNELLAKSATVVAAKHKLRMVEAKAATCMARGNIRYWECTACQKLFSDSQATQILANVAATKTSIVSHELRMIEAKAATCVAQGNHRHWECTMCSQCFADSEGTKNISQSDVMLATVAHTYDENERCFYCGITKAKATVASGICGPQLKWILDDTATLFISGTGEMYENVDYMTGAHWHSNKNIKNIIIENGVTTISTRVFQNMASLTNVTIPESVTSIGTSAFSSCTSLTEINIPENVTSIGNYAFSSCTSLTEINIPENVTSIGTSAFSSCTSLTEINIPESVTSIGTFAFSSCTSLTEINIPENVTSIGNYAFSSCTSLTEINIPESVTSIGSGTFVACRSLTNIMVDEDNKHYQSIDGNLYTKDGKALVQYAIGKAEATFIIPNSVTTIQYSAFDSCTNLSSIILPDTLSKIGNNAFIDCKALEEVTIPKNVTDIGTGVFAGCVALKSLTVAEDNPVYYSVDNCIVERNTKTLISGCNNGVIPEGVVFIEEWAMDGYTFKSLKIPNSVVSIGRYAFQGCHNLKEITIPDSVVSIEAGAFNACTKLTLVTILSKEVEIADSGNTFGEATVIYGYKGSTAEEYATSHGLQFVSID